MIGSFLNTSIFDESQIEIDTAKLSPLWMLAATAEKPGRYRGQVTNPDGSRKSFSLVVQSGTAEPSVDIDVSVAWTGDPIFSVEKEGAILVRVGQGAGGYSIAIFNKDDTILDNAHLKAGQNVIIYLYRPGKHKILDKAKGGHCVVTKQYPDRSVELSDEFIELKIQGAKIAPDNVTALVEQPIVVTVEDGSHIVTTLLAKIDRIKGELVTTLIAK